MPRGTDAILSAQHAMGHRLVVFTHRPRSEGDFKISVPFQNVVIGDLDIREESSPERTAKLRAAILETGCELMIHHVFFARCVVDDLMLFKELGIPALVQWHSCFSALTMWKRWEGHVSEQMESVVRLAGGVITLSRIDKAFFEFMGVPATHVPYSDPDMFESVPVHGNGHRILWTGRMVAGKRPLHAVQIFERVLKQFPDATLVMLGDGTHRKSVEQYLAERPELAAHVTLPGFINDVAPYLREADVFLVTTSHEGFMHSLMEAKMAALPIVGYRMDYLDTTRPGTGYCAVPQGDVDAAAAEVCRLLADPAERHRLGAAARQDFEWFLRLDQKSLYREAFDMVLHPDRHRLGEQPAYVRDVLHTLLEQMDIHSGRRRAECEDMEKSLSLRREKIRDLKDEVQRLKMKQRELKDAMKRLKGSRAYRIGRLVAWPFRKLKGIVPGGA